MAHTEERTLRPVEGGKRVESRGGDQGRSRHRRAPAFPTPPSASPPRLTPPLSVDALPGPRPQPPSGSAPGRPLPAAALRLRLRVPRPGARAPPPPPSCAHGSARLVLPASLPHPRSRGLRRPSGFSARGGLAWTPPSTGGKSVGDPTPESRSLIQKLLLTTELFIYSPAGFSPDSGGESKCAAGRKSAYLPRKSVPKRGLREGARAAGQASRCRRRRRGEREPKSAEKPHLSPQGPWCTTQTPPTPPTRQRNSALPRGTLHRPGKGVLSS
ncbi:uncharacterized protein AAG666_017484 [Megaptera novaeangliae]